MSLPKIGITLDVGQPDESRPTLELPADYPASILKAGGLPVLLPYTSDPAAQLEMIDMIDALLIPGGRDLDPALYNQPLHPETKLVSHDRADFDLAMLKLAEQRRLPILGICLGCQIINVHRQGTLHQHLPDAPRPNSHAPLLHSKKGDRSNTHDIDLTPNTKLAGILNLDSLPANSRHHQSIDKVGHNLRPAATAPDGIIEAVEDPSLPFFLAVQWHPENLAHSPHEKLFTALVQAAAAYRR